MKKSIEYKFIDYLMNTAQQQCETYEVIRR